MATHNYTSVIGNLTADPELRESKNGTQYLQFSIAANETYNGNERTDFFNVVAFNGTAKAIADNKKKGDPVLVEGKLRQNRYQDKDGNNRSEVKIEARSVQFLNRAQPRNNNNTNTNVNNQANEEDYDDIPF